MFRDQSVAVVIPALNEEAAIGRAVGHIDRTIVDAVIVVDNGSTDRTAERARAAGALVVAEPRRGYGSACLRGIEAAGEADVLVFMDGDGSDDASQIGDLLATLIDDDLEMVLGSRMLGEREPGALTPLQRFGSVLTCSLVRAFWGVRFTDLGPFRAIRRQALARLQMADPDFGWTIEMQVKAAQQQLRVAEVPTRYRLRRAGQSKVSGTILGSYRAGKRILGYVFAAKVGELWPGQFAAKKLDR
jgi:glycosyltransferase involved in cell wall biosynthesis